ncbi:GNAT family N-acetyltransferase [Paenibacillus sp. MMS20-IR301]|uniref:GNAT family N-acetyltransferase n=1 Tax=Paenibacillus sp. MMS20-IR301 TaxID=2895946 RepID=UPI0028E47519|nr:GNAT family N-acetyltransferase [Paenibacillus sp. MMS20-IR301]WNS46704.1 GNAT family N-acetyltransferase [Paenibacillus sp. MMS20-IR301]
MLTITKAGEEELEAMCLLLQELFGLERDFAGTDNADTTAKQEAGLRLILKHPERGQLLLLKRGVKVVGMVNLIFTFSTFEGGPVIMLEDFIIAAEERGQGSGRFFMDSIVAYAKEQGFLRITLLADADNARALHFYEAAGYGYSNMRCLRLVVK